MNKSLSLPFSSCLSKISNCCFHNLFHIKKDLTRRTESSLCIHTHTQLNSHHLSTSTYDDERSQREEDFETACVMPSSPSFLSLSFHSFLSPSWIRLFSHSSSLLCTRTTWINLNSNRKTNNNISRWKLPLLRKEKTSLYSTFTFSPFTIPFIMLLLPSASQPTSDSHSL